MSNQNSIDAALVRRIKRSGLTPCELAHELGGVMDKATIRNLVTGKNSPTTRNAAVLADYFGLRLR